MVTYAPTGPTAEPDVPREIQTALTGADSAFRRIATAAGVITLGLLVVIGYFLLTRGIPALRHEGLSFLTGTTFQFNPAKFGIAALLYWTVVIAVIALLISVPVGVVAALFLTDFVPLRLRKPLTSLVDLLAAVPSIIYGLWGLFFLQPHLKGTLMWVSHHLGFIPFFHATREQYSASALMAGIVVSLMVVPIVTSIVREVFSQTPPGEKEAALALGATRWGMIRTVVLPFGRGGIVGGAMLGLGRALGETIAVALIISPTFTVRADVISSGANGIAPFIALKFGEAPKGLAISGLMAAGLALFVLTLVVNFLASMIVSRSRSGAGVEL